MLIPVIMAGGVGSRLWPLSRELQPKQFIAFQPGKGSLFQETLTRLAPLDCAPPIVVCNEEHRFLAAEQLRQAGVNGASLLLEPVGRNTAPAVALAALQALRSDPDALLLVLAADHLIAEPALFIEAVRRGLEPARAGKLLTFGIVPQHPETGYGYIRRGAALGEGYAVQRFVEKPDLDSARDYLASGEYYWNSGMFLFTAARYLEELERHAPAMLDCCRRALAGATRDLDFLRIPKDEFARCPADSIDYAIMEHTEEGLVLPLDAGWSDLGAWSALWQHFEHDAQGNAVSGDVLLHASQGCLVQAQSRLVSVVGLDEAVVVETPDAVLVASRARVQEVKEIVKRLKQQGRREADAHALVNRPWGSYESLVNGPGYQVKRIIVKPGASLSLQLHYKRAEHWTVVSGRAKVTNGDSVFILNENESTYIPIQARHRLENPSDEPVVLIEVQCGAYLGEDDIVRFEDNYGRLGVSA